MNKLVKKYNFPPVRYLAGPYTHPDSKVERQREKDHSKWAVKLKKQGYIIYAPIPETTALAKLGGLKGTTWEDWRNHDLNMLARCDELWIVPLDGWQKSVGLRGEVKFALTNKMTVRVIDIKTGEILITSPDYLLGNFGVKRVSDLND